MAHNRFVHVAISQKISILILVLCTSMQKRKTPLHHAVEAKSLKCAQLLIENKANVNAKDKVFKNACACVQQLPYTAVISYSA